MNEHHVVIAGAGPTGLMLAGELALAGIDVAIVERRANQDLVGARAAGLHARTLEVLDQRGIADRFVAQGKTYPAVHFNLISLDITDAPTRHNYTLGLFQNRIERVLAEWIGELAVTIYREREVTGFAQDGAGVDVSLASGESLRAQYLVGCDGGRSAIRKAAGIDFPGTDATTSWLIIEAQTLEEPQWGFHHDAIGIHAIGKSDDGGARIVMTESRLRLESEPTLCDVREALIAVYGTDFGIHSPTWISRFTDMTRQAAAYRDRRVLIAGDAAHVHPPVGGKGLNMGVQDAVNLGWKLAQVINSRSPATLLDTYHAERHPVAARVLRDTIAQVALRRTDASTKALNETVCELFAMDQPRRRMAAEMSGLAIRYDFGEGHPLLGRRMPDIEITTGGGPVRVFTLLHEARPVLLDFGARDGFDISPWADRVRSIRAEYSGAWDLPVVGIVTAPKSVLIRPDGYVAWVRENHREGLADALTRWFGPPAAM